jgi:hypothetical protein
LIAVIARLLIALMTKALKPDIAQDPSEDLKKAEILAIAMVPTVV